MSSTELERRWRLILGKYSERQLPSLDSNGERLDRSLDYLYGRLYAGRGVRPGAALAGEKHGGDEESNPHIVEWLEAIRDLFPENVAAEIEAEAVERFGLSELLTDPVALQRVEASEDMLKLVLSLRSQIPAEAMSQVRRIITEVVEEMTLRLRQELQSVLSGRVNKYQRTKRVTGAVDVLRTIQENLHTWDASRERLLIEDVTFFNKTKLRHPWDIVLCVDQSGSMASSVINSAVMAGILSGLPGVNVKVVVFDTAVVDLTTLADDPVETLMTVQLGGGTDIAQAMRYVEQIINTPSRTIVALITDFYEGGSVADLVRSVARLTEAGVTTMGLAALEDGGGPAHDQHTASRCAAAGMRVASMSPSSFAEWALGVIG